MHEVHDARGLHGALECTCMQCMVPEDFACGWADCEAWSRPSWREGTLGGRRDLSEVSENIRDSLSMAEAMPADLERAMLASEFTATMWKNKTQYGVKQRVHCHNVEK